MYTITKLKSKIIEFIIIFFRVKKYSLLSDIKSCRGKPIKVQPILMRGNGTIIFGSSVVIGVKSSPFFHNGYAFLNARNSNTKIYIDSRVWANNNLVIICEGEGVYIGKDTLIGTNVEIYDSDFHEIQLAHRKFGVAATKKVHIGNKVWLGSNVKILKGVTIGDNSIIANGSVVSRSIPENVIAAGIPAKVIRNEINIDYQQNTP